MCSLDIRLDKYDRCYYVGDTVTGVIIVDCPSRTSHNGIKVSIDGETKMKLSIRNMSVYESFASSMKPMSLLHEEIDIASGGRFDRGAVVEFPFEFVLNEPTKSSKLALYETYHGVYINTQYMITVVMSRSFPNKKIEQSMEFIVKSSTGKRGFSPDSSTTAGTDTVAGSAVKWEKEIVPFHITAERIRNLPKSMRSEGGGLVRESGGKSGGGLPSSLDTKTAASSTTATTSKKSASKKTQVLNKFEITGAFQSGICNVEEPFLGELTVEQSENEIASIELQFVRVETVIVTGSKTEIREATEVQNIQLADGDIVRGIPIPIYMIFPRLFTCVSTIGPFFKVEFEVNVVVLFKDGNMITENYPISLLRRHTRKFF